jgi:hypothetical protein
MVLLSDRMTRFSDWIISRHSPSGSSLISDSCVVLLSPEPVACSCNRHAAVDDAEPRLT